MHMPVLKEGVVDATQEYQVPQIGTCIQNIVSSNSQG